MSEKIEVKDIRTDGGTQARAGLNQSAVAEYIELLENSNGEWPFNDPVELFYDGKDYWLADGFHRVEACRKHGRFVCLANVNQGTKRDAVLYSVGANAAHGIRRSQDDKRRAVMRLLEDSEWSGWSDREIARRCKVSAPLVGKLRKEATVNIYSNEPQERTYVRNGTVATMRTAGIGAVSTRGQENGLKQTVKQVQENMNAAAVDWLRRYKDNDGRTWDDLTDTQTHHANSPCYQKFVMSFPSAHADHKFSLKQARAVLKRELESEPPGPEDRHLNIGELRELAIGWKRSNTDGYLSGFVDYLDRTRKRYVLSAAECAYQEALTIIRLQNTHVTALVESIKLLDERQTSLMELAADVYQKDEPAEIVQVWRAFKGVIKAVHTQ